MDKGELRKYIKKLKALHQATALADSEAIMQKLETDVHFLQAQTVLLYHSLPDEVNTHDFIRKWGQVKTLLLPVVVGDNLELKVYSPSQELHPGAFGISEPDGITFTDYASIGFVAVPGMAFDKAGNRLGRGKGYYDRLLPNLPNAYKAGICYPYQLVEEVPTEATDIKMDGVIC